MMQTKILRAIDAAVTDLMTGRSLSSPEKVAWLADRIYATGRGMPVADRVATYAIYSDVRQSIPSSAYPLLKAVLRAHSEDAEWFDRYESQLHRFAAMMAKRRRRKSADPGPKGRERALA